MSAVLGSSHRSSNIWFEVFHFPELEAATVQKFSRLRSRIYQGTVFKNFPILIGITISTVSCYWHKYHSRSLFIKHFINFETKVAFLGSCDLGIFCIHGMLACSYMLSFSNEARWCMFSLLPVQQDKWLCHTVLQRCQNNKLPPCNILQHWALLQTTAKMYWFNDLKVKQTFLRLKSHFESIEVNRTRIAHHKMP